MNFSEKAFEEFKNNTADNLGIIKKFSELVKFADNNLFEKLQSMLVNFGENLENNYGFEGSEVIKLLEECCEDIYNCTCNPEENALESLSKKLLSIEDVLLGCINVKPCRLSVVAIMRNEGEYVKEWIEYHKMMGVEHFYIYDNESTDNFTEVIKPYIDEGSLTYTFYPGDLQQLNAYNDAIKNYRHVTDYMAFIDGDEFIVPGEKGKKIYEIMDEIIEGYKSSPYRKATNIGGVGINWRMYGTSHLKEKPKGLVTENYLYRAPDGYGESVHIKTICNPRAVSGFFFNPHIPGYYDNYDEISPNGSLLGNSPFFCDAHFDKLYINHYYTKSEGEYIAKLKRGWPCFEHEQFTDEHMYNELKKREHYNDVYSPEILEYTDELRKRMNL
ncbi:MAG: glycosyltransferase family 92 protein [Eubacterium sp.]|nr:glycosyltransferase family 92 protein [Eubacterium sp.]